MIRPVEFQGVVQRNQDVASLNQNEHDKPFINQENILSETKKEIEVKVRDVKNKDNADNNAKNPDAKEKGSNEYFGDGGKHRKKWKNVEGTVRIKERQNFDVKI